jgi:hypothetical protein
VNPRSTTAAIVAALVLPVCFAGPVRVFLANASMLPVAASTVAVAALLLTAAAFVPLYLAARLWPRVLLPFLAALAIVAFAEFTIFLPLAAHRPFDGQPIEWDSRRRLAVVELAAAAAVAVAAWRWRHRPDVWQNTAVAILAFHAIGLAWTAWDRREALRSHAGAPSHAYFDQFHRLSRTRNVIHIVADTVQGAMVRDIIQADPGRHASVFDGFTLFTQAMGRYPSTFPSVPYYMTGRAPKAPETDVAWQPFTSEYVRRTLEEHSVVGALAAGGYRTFGYQFSGLYCAGRYSACVAGPVFEGRAPQQDDRYRPLRQIADVALFQTSPIVLRRRIFDDGDWWLTGGRRARRTFAGILDLFVSRLSADAPAPTYNYFHLIGGHAPFLFDEGCRHVGVQDVTTANQRRQVACTLGQVERLIEALREAGLYDQTLIVVHGDHGTTTLPPHEAATPRPVPAFVIDTASTLLLVKPVGARGPLRHSTVPAMIGDVPATLSDALALGAAFPGVSLLRLNGAPRTREFVTYDRWEQVPGDQALRNPRRYFAGPDIFEEGQWTRASAPVASGTPSRLWMDDPRFEQFAAGFGRLEMQPRPARWITGRGARLRLASPSASAQVVVECFVPGFIRGQSATLVLNGHVVGQLGPKALAQPATHTFPIRENLLKQGDNVVELRMSKTVRPPGDRRELAMVVAYVGLEPPRPVPAGASDQN